MTVTKKSAAKSTTSTRRGRKTAIKSTTTKSTAPRKTPAAKSKTKTSTAKKAAKKTAAKKTAVKKPTTKKTTAKKSTAKKVTPATLRKQAKEAAKKATASSQKLVKKMATKQPTTKKAPPKRKAASAKSILYLGHATRWNFKEHLYQPLRESHFSQEFHLILPHEQSLEPTNTKAIIENSNVMLAEVSYPSTGLGIEIGWAEVFDIPIIAFYQEGRSPTNALKLVAHDVFSYDSMQDLIEKLSIRLHSK